MANLGRRLNKLEDDAHLSGEREDEEERQKRLKMTLEAAEQANERFFRELAIERRKAFLEDIGYEGHTSEELRDENFLYAEDEPPFAIGEDGAVFSTRDGKPITDSHQTLAEQWYFDYVAMGNPGELYHDEETQGFYMPNGELAFSRDRCYLPRFFHAIGDTRADPYCISVAERIDIP
jgi:hypothetical protein